MQNLHKRQMQLAKERGEFAASLVKKNDILEQERVRIMDDLRKIKKGDFNSIRKNAAGVMIASKIVSNPMNFADEDRRLPSQAQRMREKLTEDYEKLQKLKKQHEQTIGKDDSQSLTEPVRDLYRPEATVVSPSFSNSKLQNLPVANQKNRFLNEIENIRNQKNNEYVPRVPTPQMQSPGLNNQNSFTNQYQNPMMPPNQSQLANPYTQNPYMQNPYMQNPYMQNPYMQNPYMQNPYMQNPYIQNPYMQNPFGYPFPPYPPVQQAPAEDPEAKNLMLKIKKLKKKLKDPQNDEFYNSLQDGLKSIQQKLNNTDPRNPENPSANIANTEILPEERALRNVMQQEQNELKLLAALPKGSELYNAKLDHYKEMTQIRMRMEAMLQEIALNRMKKNFERDMELEDRKIMNEK